MASSSSSLCVKLFEKDNNASVSDDDIKRKNEWEKRKREWENERRERQRKRKEEDEEFLREPPFRAICFKAAELEAYSRHPNSDRNEAKVQEDVRRSVEEEIRKQNQASCAPISARNTARRLSKNKDGCDNNTRTKALPENKDGCDQNPKMPAIAKLNGVTIFPKVDGQGGDTICGTLEAHVDGFIYTTSTSNFHSELTYEYDNVKVVFFQGEDEEKIPPLMHFRLYHPIKVGTENRDHIQFRLVPNSEGERRPDNNLEKFEKEKQTRDSGCSKDLKDFVLKVGTKWWGSCPPPFSFRQVSKRVEFRGVLPSKKASDRFVVTFGAIIQLTNTPFVVVTQEDIELVHLARIRPEEIDMTIISMNFNVLQISSIPLDSLEGIKTSLDNWGLKFYDNNLYLDWGSMVKNIAKNPENFFISDAYKLEDRATLLYYKHYSLQLSQTPVIDFKDRIQG